MDSLGARNQKIRNILMFLTSDELTEDERQELSEELKSRRTKKSKVILSILFPEFTRPCRLPNRFGQLTAVFRTYRYFDVRPGTDGKIAIAFYPRQLYYAASDTTNRQPMLSYWKELNSAGDVLNTARVDQYSDQLFDYFDEVALRAAVIRIYYVGSALNSQGYLCGAYDYSFDIAGVNSVASGGAAWNTTMIENGYNKRFGTPEEGLRLVWYPKNEDDMNYFSISQTSATSNLSRQQALLIYGMNLATDATLRVDVVRHIEGLPNHNVRPYMQVKRPEPGEPDDVYEDLCSMSVSIGELITISPRDASEIKSSLGEIVHTMYEDELAPVYDKYGDENLGALIN